MDWKETVTSVSEKVFPGLSHKFEDKDNIGKLHLTFKQNKITRLK